MRKGYVDIPEGQLHYRSDGSGENLLLLHQAPMSSEEYEGVLPLLAAHYHAIAIDLPGHGNSDDPPREYEIEDFAASVISFLDAMGIDKTSIVGHHTGALVAIEVAVTHPERINKIVLSGCPVWEPEKWQRYLSRPMSRDIPMTADGGFILKTWEAYKTLSGRSDLRQWFKPFLVGLEARTRPYDAHYAVGRYRVKPRLGLIKSPTLLISGTEDYFYKDLKSTRSMIPGAVIGVIEGGGVFTAREKPEAFAEAILTFLRQNAGGA